MALSTEPLLLRTAKDLLAHLERERAKGGRVGFVPTMGALHEGHLALAQAARARVGPEGCVLVSVFVNPTQFGPKEDFHKYPRELQADVERCRSVGVDAVFSPPVEEMYPPGASTTVDPGRLAEPLCGAFRPGHFVGVATIVCKLFALTAPCTAVFGRKDYQQWRILTALARDLLLPVEVVGMSTVREADGLALSSRNRYLSPEDRERASAIPRGLRRAAELWSQGVREPSALTGAVLELVRPIADSIDYVDLRHPETLAPYEAAGDRGLPAVALRVGGTRLIDNTVLGEDAPP